MIDRMPLFSHPTLARRAPVEPVHAALDRQDRVDLYSLAIGSDVA